MDLTRPVTYRSLQLNTASFSAGVPVSGIVLEEVDYHGVQGSGYREKRSLSDGLDASDVFLGGRTVTMRGTIYGISRADLFDRLAELRAALSPTGAYAESPGDLGYLPLNFDVPTLDTADWGTGFIPQMIRVRPLGLPQFTIARDKLGGEAALGMSISWSCAFEARDPRIYAQDEVEVVFSAGGNASSGSDTVENRGLYPTPIKVSLFSPAADAARIFTLTGFGSVMEITIPNSANDQTVRYDGVEKYLSIEELGVETVRMDLLEFPTGVNHPLIPAGESAWSWTYTDDGLTPRNINAASQFWFWEAWA